MSTNLIFLFSLLFILVLISFLSSSLRNKFFFFIMVIILSAIWAFLYNLDGMALILLTAEFTIILLFMMTYIQLYTNFDFFTVKHKKSKLYILIFLIPLFTSLTSTLNYTNYYQSLNHTVSSDFFIIYYLLFDKLPLLTVFLTLIISLFSFFFILLYFNLKFVKNLMKYKVKLNYFLRKQNLIKQTNFKTKLYTFQN